MAQPRTRKPRQDGNPRPIWTFRPSADAQTFVEACSTRERIGKPSFVAGCLEDIKDIRAELGDEWYELERQAKIEGVTAGVVLGRLAKAALEKNRKK